jgi:site-specific DNA-methyltransferase (adenine-specific)
MNPPYGRKLSWWAGVYFDLGGIHTESVIALLPARTDTVWFNDFWYESAACCFWKGRIKFVGAPHPSPFPSVLFYAGPNPHKFCDIFQKKGIVVLI